MSASGSSRLARAEHFLWLTARVLEQRRFAYHFLGGSPDAVEAALGAYRNPDHGYGHALDPALRGPASQPLHAVAALRTLDEIGQVYGVTRERIRQIESKTMSKLRHPSRSQVLRDYLD